MSTPEQDKANKTLDDAIYEAVQAYGSLDDQVVIDWIVVVEGGSMSDLDDTAKFGMLHRGGQARHTVAIGLLEVGKEMLTENDRVDDDEETA